MTSIARRGPWAAVALCAAVFSASMPVSAMDVDYLRQLVPVAQKQIKPYGEDMFGDKVSLYDGSLSFEQTDLDLKGNFDLPVRLSRSVGVGKKSKQYTFNRPLGNWEWNLPRVGGSFSVTKGWQGTSGNNRCSGYTFPAMEFAAGQSVAASDFWHGTNLEIPGAGRQELLKRTASSPPGPTTGGPYPLLTKQLWQVGCLSTIKNGAGEGFYAISPTGVRYDFDWMDTRALDPIRFGSQLLFDRQEVYLYATKVTDRFGNWVSYTYDAADPGLVQSIQSSDGRTITVTNSGGRAVSATDGTRTYTYGYGGYVGKELVSVGLPDGRQWTFDLQSLNPKDLGNRGTADLSCATGMDYMLPDIYDGTVTHPSGAQAKFTMKYFYLEYTDVQTACNTSNGLGRWDVMPDRAVIGLSDKVITGSGLVNQSWKYEYGLAGTTPCASGCSYTNVTNPDGTVTRQAFGNRWHVNEGQLLYVMNGWNGTSALQTTATVYQVGGPTQSFPEMFGESYARGHTDWMGPVNAPTKTVTITRDGTSFANNVEEFDESARPVRTTKSGPGGQRTEQTRYHDSPSLWVMGQVAEVLLVDRSKSPTSLVSMRRTGFDSLDRPDTIEEFGLVKGRQTYSSDGTIATKSDAAGNTVAYSDYKRGIAQRVHYPNGAAEEGVVNNIGLLTSYTDALNYTSSYGYDVMGRLTSVTPPASYLGTSVIFEPVAVPEYGLAAGHWRQTVSKGNSRSVVYFDLMWRPVMSRTWDVANEAETRRVVVKQFDTQNRVIYESYPQREISSVADRPAGKYTQYDPLGRAWEVKADSELGKLTTMTEYLPGFRIRVTNPRGFQTIQTMWALDKPDEASIIRFDAPLGVTAIVARDVFGKPTSISRGGVTRSYVYDAGQRLCKTVEPEVGSTVQDYDLAGNIAWKAPGQALPSTTTCDTASVPAAGKISYEYDPIGQLKTTTYGDGKPSVSRTYTPDAKLKTIASDGSTWVYDYNPLRQLSSEILNFNGQQYSFAWNYNTAGDLSSLVYPDNTTVAYNPNGLGEATTASGFVSNVTYHPNGALAGFSRANNIAHSLSLNVRGLPYENEDAGVMKDRYTYDENGNVKSITDVLEGIFNRSMTYDELDRLLTANSPSVWGNATYTYDAIDNITSATVGGRASTMGYDGRNRLSTVISNGALFQYQYDPQGNILSKGDQTYVFDLGNRMRSSNRGGSYQYDGHGRRTWIQNNDGSTRVQVYSQGGQLLWAVGDDVQPNVPATIASYSCSSGTLSGTNCVTTSTYGATANGYVCNAGDSLSGTTCTHVETSTYGASVASYSCAAGDSLSGSTCSHTYVANTYAASPNYVCNAGDSLSGSTCSHTNSSPATPVYSCPSGFSLNGTTCSKTTNSAASVSSYSCDGLGSPNASQLCTGVTGWSVDEADSDVCQYTFTNGLVFQSSTRRGAQLTCYFQARPVYSCPNGGTLNGTQCSSTSTQVATVSSYTCSSGSVSGSSCLTTSTYGASVASYSCNAGDSLSGTTCSHSATSTYNATPSYACSAGDSLSGSTCTRTTTSTYGASVSAWACNSGDSLSGSTCTHTSTAAATPNYSCSSGTLSGSTCVGGRKLSKILYAYLAGKQVAEVTNGAVVYTHTDALGSPVARTGPGPVLLTRTRFEPYGRPATAKPSKETSVIGFTGHVQDAETDLVYMEQRYYDPVAGRFLSVDPVVAKSDSLVGFGRYHYASLNPYRFVDPDGRNAFAFIIKLFDKGGSKIVAPLAEKADAVAARRAGENVLAGSKSDAKQIEEAAFGKEDLIRHKKHKLDDGSYGKPHYQTDGKHGHTFWGGIKGVIDPDLLEALLTPIWATPTTLAPGTLYGPGTPYKNQEEFIKAFEGQGTASGPISGVVQVSGRIESRELAKQSQAATAKTEGPKAEKSED